MRTDRRVIVGVDGSIGSLAALRFGLREVESGGGSLHAVHAWSPPGGEATVRRGMPSSLVRVWRAMAETTLRTAFDEAVGGLPARPDVHLEVVRGDPGPVLTRRAGRPTDLLVIGARPARPGRPAWYRPGRARAYCQRHAVCPLVLVPPPPMASLAGPRGIRSRRWPSSAPVRW